MAAQPEQRNSFGFPTGSEPVRYAWDDSREGGKFWPKLAEEKPHQIDYCGDEPISDTAKALWIAAILAVLLACVAAVLLPLVLSVPK